MRKSSPPNNSGSLPSVFSRPKWVNVGLVMGKAGRSEQFATQVFACRIVSKQGIAREVRHLLWATPSDNLGYRFPLRLLQAFELSRWELPLPTVILAVVSSQVQPGDPSLMPLDRRISNRSPQNHSSRKNPARVLRVYLLMLGLVFILFYEALDTSNWEWIAPTRRVSVATESPPQPVRMLDSATPSDDLKQKLSVVSDDSLQIRPAEQPLYWELLEQGKSENWGSADSPLRPTYQEVMEKLPQHRGTLLSATGKLRRLLRYEIDRSGTPVPLYEGWFFTSDSGNHPWVVQFLDAPPGVTPGDELSLPISVTGLLFKNYEYESKAGLSAAPLLITDQVRITPQAVAVTPTTSRRRNLLPLAIILFGLLFFLKYVSPGMFKPIRTRRRQPEDLPERIELPADPPLSVVKDLWEEEEAAVPPPSENSPSAGS